MAFICFHFNGVHADYQQEKQMLHWQKIEYDASGKKEQ
jgi:hypothetical protein